LLVPLGALLAVESASTRSSDRAGVAKDLSRTGARSSGVHRAISVGTIRVAEQLPSTDNAVALPRFRPI
jgi:hypothetical protein